MDGWIKLYRSFLTNGHLQSMPDAALRIWVISLLSADIRNGQFTTSYSVLREQTGYGRSTISQALAWLEQPPNNTPYISREQRTGQPMRIQVVNWRIYQSSFGTGGDGSSPVSGLLNGATRPKLGPHPSETRTGDTPQSQSTSASRTSLRREERKNKKGERSLDPTETERHILHELKQVRGYPFNSDRDLEYIRMLVVDFPTLDIREEIKKWRTYKLDKPLEKKSNPRSQLRNWCSKAVEFAERRRGYQGGIDHDAASKYDGL